MELERTFVMVKPDGVARGFSGRIIARLEEKGYRLVAMKLMRITPELAETHYAQHRERPFFPGLVRFITSGPVVAMVWEGRKAISGIRTLMGATDPSQAAPGTIRGDFAVELSGNMIHGSDSPEAAEREIGLFFREEERVPVQRADWEWLYPEG